MAAGGTPLLSGSSAEQRGDDFVALDVENALVRRFNAHCTFTWMTARRLQRRYRGVYKKDSFVMQLVTWIVVIYTLAVLAVLAFGSDDQNDDSSTSNSVFYMVIIIAVVYVFVQVAMIVRWVIYWVIVAEMLTYAVTSNIYALFWLDTSLSDTQVSQRNAIIVALVIVEVVTVLVAYFLYYLYPGFVLKNIVDAMRWWSVHPGRRNNTLTYQSSPILHTKKRNLIKYSGGLNGEGQPHGYGMWTDTSYHGERLTGQWENGIPIGPFRSFEHGSGYSFVNLRIGFCHNRGEATPDAVDFFPKHSQDGLHWGVASVECSVSGGFFRFLPSVNHITHFNEPNLRNASDISPILRTPADDVVFSHKPEKTNKKVTKRQIFRESSCPVLGSSSTSVVEKEALVFLHGYNCSLDYGMNRLAQLLALGDFPSYIHPFVFSWPSGGTLAYFQAKSVGSESEQTASDFESFLTSLADAGYTSINIVAHSMGARVYFNALQSGLLSDVFIPVGSSANMANGKARMYLSTLTFANPDYSRDEFVKYGGGYDLSTRFCKHITLYADSMDGALFYSEVFSKKQVCGPLAYALGRRGYMMHRDEPSHRENEDLLLQELNVSQSVAMDSAVVMVNQQRKFAGVTSFAYNNDPEQSEEGADQSVREQLEEYLDMDVIDTTWMDNNVHAIRHNYFNLNPTIVEDLRHLIIGKKRASLRPSLLKTMAAENVYIFLVAPSHVKNK